MNERWMYEWEMNVWMRDECMNEKWMYNWKMHVWIRDECMNERWMYEWEMNVWMRDEWMNKRWMDEWEMNGWMRDEAKLLIYACMNKDVYWLLNEWVNEGSKVTYGWMHVWMKYIYVTADDWMDESGKL